MITKKRGEVLANEENLVPFSERTTSEQREIAQKGGIASGETRRKRKTLKENMNILLSLPITDDTQKKEAIKLGIDINTADNSTLVALALFKKAVDFGDVAAIKELRNLIGEDVTENQSTGKLESLINGLKDE